MRKIREVLRLRDEHGASQRQIVAACRLPRSTVRDYLRRLQAAGLTHAAVATWTDGVPQPRRARSASCGQRARHGCCLRAKPRKGGCRLSS